MDLAYELTYSETIAGPWGPTDGSPFGSRLCWSVPQATLHGERIEAELAMPGADWIRVGDDGIRRQDQRLTFVTDDGEVIMLAYDTALIRESTAFLAALEAGTPTEFADQHIRIVAEFDTGAERYRWLTQSLFLGEGRLAGPRRIEYRVFRVT